MFCIAIDPLVMLVMQVTADVTVGNIEEVWEMEILKPFDLICKPVLRSSCAQRLALSISIVDARVFQPRCYVTPRWKILDAFMRMRILWLYTR